jgi:hypothetical protein
MPEPLNQRLKVFEGTKWRRFSFLVLSFSLLLSHIYYVHTDSYQTNVRVLGLDNELTGRMIGDDGVKRLLRAVGEKNKNLRSICLFGV